MNKTVKLAFTATFTALAIAANTFTIPLTPSNSISFTIAISFIAGIYLGPLSALTVGYLGDLIGAIIHPMGPYNWFMALSCALTGFICALVYKLKLHKLLKLAIAMVIYLIVCSIALNTFGLWLQIIVGVDPSPIGLLQFWGMDKGGIRKSFWVYLAGRLPFMLINWAVNGTVVAILQQSKALDKMFAQINKRTEKKRLEKEQAEEKPEETN